MFTALAFLAIYGMGVGATLAIHDKLLGDWDGIEIPVALCWPLTLPAMLVWWVITSWIGEPDE